MAADVKSLVFRLYGEDKTASKALGKVGDETEKTGNKLGKFAGVAAGAFAAVGVAKFAKDSIGAYGEVARETAKLQRYIGGTAEDASRLRFAAEESGVGVDDLAGGLGKMSKAMVGGGKAFKSIGVEVLDSNGKMKSANEVFRETAERLSKMPAGAQKTAATLALFGKAGMGLGPMLNRGAEGIAKLEEESDKLGTTMSGKDLAATKANTMAKRQFHAAVMGLQISLGRALYPALTMVSTILAQIAPQLGPVLVPMFKLLGTTISQVVAVVKVLLPVIIGVAGVLAAHPALIQMVVVAVVAIVAAMKVWAIVTKANTLATKALNIAMSMNPIGLVVLAIVALIAILVVCYLKVGWFRAGVNAAFAGVKNAIMGTINWVRNNWPLLLAILTGPIGIAVLVISRNWSRIKADVTAAKNWVGHEIGGIVGFFTGMPGRISRAASGMFRGVTDAFRSAINEIIGGWNRLHFSINIPSVHIPGTNSDIGGGSIGFGVPSIPFLASGGRITRSGAVVVGDAGPEVLDLPRGATVTPLGRASAGQVHVHVHVTQPLGTPEQIVRAVLPALQSAKARGVAVGLG